MPLKYLHPYYVQLSVAHAVRQHHFNLSLPDRFTWPGQQLACRGRERPNLLRIIGTQARWISTSAVPAGRARAGLYNCPRHYFHRPPRFPLSSGCLLLLFLSSSSSPLLLLPLPSSVSPWGPPPRRLSSHASPWPIRLGRELWSKRQPCGAAPRDSRWHPTRKTSGSMWLRTARGGSGASTAPHLDS